MSKTLKVLIVLALAGTVGAVLVSKQWGAARSESGAEKTAIAGEGQAPTASARLPRLLDLGATKCIPCKMMAPILEELKKEYAGRMDVEFIDVWQNREAGQKYGISSIPTQIFFDASGKELFRHEGFIAKQDILAKWKELGVALATSSRPAV